MAKHVKLVDCTLRDGGYYNQWDFSPALVAEYLAAMDALGVDYAELGFRSLSGKGFKGAFAYTTDSQIRALKAPPSLRVGVMVNASELVAFDGASDLAVDQLFGEAAMSPVSLVRLACHMEEVQQVLPAVDRLKSLGYAVGLNLMQIAGRGREEIEAMVREIAASDIDVLYFADSLGSLNPDEVAEVVSWLRGAWDGELGIHTHDNMSLALANTKRAVEEGISWIDGTVLGMGRGPGNARTEYLAMEFPRSPPRGNIAPLLKLVSSRFVPMQRDYGWGTNAYYFLAGKYGIHPTYIQEMLSNSRYSDEDMIAAIEYLKIHGGRRFSLEALRASKSFYAGDGTGSWDPSASIRGRKVLILGSGPGTGRHRQAIESLLRSSDYYVIGLNVDVPIDSELIDVTVACHPIRLLADCDRYGQQHSPLVAPFGMLPSYIQEALASAPTVLDYGVVMGEKFAFGDSYCTIPNFLAAAYALAIATSGDAESILLAGFDGYPGDDPRNAEMNDLLERYSLSPGAKALLAVTATRYNLDQTSVYWLASRGHVR